MKDMAVQKSWETRVVRYSWDVAELKKDLYRREAITKEALKLLEIVAELRKDQVQVSTECGRERWRVCL